MFSGRQTILLSSLLPRYVSVWIYNKHMIYMCLWSIKGHWNIVCYFLNISCSIVLKFEIWNLKYISCSFKIKWVMWKVGPYVLAPIFQQRPNIYSHQCLVYRCSNLRVSHAAGWWLIDVDDLQSECFAKGLMLINSFLWPTPFSL
jgi:hypothetical protein